MFQFSDLRLISFICVVGGPAMAQQLPPLDPAVQLGVCQQQRAIFLSDSEQAQTLIRQLLVERDALKAKLDEAEAKISKEEK